MRENQILFDTLENGASCADFKRLLNKRTWWGKRLYDPRAENDELDSLLFAAMERGRDYAEAVWRAQTHRTEEDIQADFDALLGAVAQKDVPLATFLLDKDVIARYMKLPHQLWREKDLVSHVLYYHYEPTVAAAFIDKIDVQHVDVLSDVLNTGDVHLTRKLLDKGIELPVTALFDAIDKSDELVHLLLDRGASTFLPFHEWANYLSLTPSAAVARRLVKEKGVDVNEVNPHTGRTPLMETKSVAVFEELLKLGARTNTLDSQGNTIWAHIIDDKEKVALALAKRANPNRLMTVGQDGLTPLMSAILKHRLSIVQMLLAAGADVSPQDTSGYTALHYAAAKFDLKTIQLLLNAGASPAIPNKNGWTPFNVLQLKAKQHPRSTRYVTALQLLRDAMPKHESQTFKSPVRVYRKEQQRLARLRDRENEME